jgi:integral membrane protein
MDVSNPVQRFRVVAIIEATSWIVLWITMVWRRGFDGPDLSATLGPIHGILFLAYLVAALQVRTAQHWNGIRTAMVIFAAVIPIAGYFIAARLSDQPSAAGSD